MDGVWITDVGTSVAASGATDAVVIITGTFLDAAVTEKCTEISERNRNKGKYKPTKNFQTNFRKPVILTSKLISQSRTYMIATNIRSLKYVCFKRYVQQKIIAGFLHGDLC